jgi:peptidyl-prolyl cis-trans isomerase C
MLRRASFAVALLVGLACSKTAAPAKKGPVVAEGGGITVTADELKARLDEQSPMIRASFNNLDRKKQFLDNMLRFELLAKAAEKEGLANDPDVQFTMKKVMVSKYYQRFFQNDQAAKAVPDADVQKYYDEHKDEFHRPARLHAAHIFFKAEAGAPERSKKAAEAKKLLAKVLADEKKNPAAFAATARASSEDTVTKNLGGDLAFKTRDELVKTYGEPFAEAAFKLADNQTSPTVLETKEGFHLVRVLGRQPEVNRSLEEVKGQIAAKLNSQRKTKEFDEFVKKLREQANIKVNEAELEKVAVAAGPTGMGAPHGMGLGPRMPPAPSGSGAPPAAPAAAGSGPRAPSASAPASPAAPAAPGRSP